jgi:hypothetical protein
MDRPGTQRAPSAERHSGIPSSPTAEVWIPATPPPSARCRRSDERAASSVASDSGSLGSGEFATTRSTPRRSLSRSATSKLTSTS